MRELQAQTKASYERREEILLKSHQESLDLLRTMHEEELANNREVLVFEKKDELARAK